MTCHHLNSERCGLAERLVSLELDLPLECPVTPETCERCQAKGLATEERPTLPCLGTATKVMPEARRAEWSAYCSWIVGGKSRGLGDTIAKITRATGIAAITKAVSKATGKGCGCRERQKRENAKHPYSDSHSSTAAAQEKSERGGVLQ